jgi:hypothetical protein
LALGLPSPSEGRIRDFECFFAARTGPNFCVIRGEPEALMAFTSAQETMVANMKAALINEGFQRGLYATGDAVEAMMGLFGQTVEQFERRVTGVGCRWRNRSARADAGSAR